MRGNIESAALIIAIGLLMHGCQTAPSSITAAYVAGFTSQEGQE